MDVLILLNESHGGSDHETEVQWPMYQEEGRMK
jgi:hypothetical protein